MEGLIFAAGLGTRLLPLTLTKPKALIEVGGVAMLERVVRRMAEAGIRHIIINVHHHAEAVRGFVADKGDFGLGVNVELSDESDLLLDTGGGLLKALPLLGDGPVLIHNADILTDLDFRPMLDAHLASGAAATLLATDRPSSRGLWFDHSGRMHGWGNRSTGENRPVGLDTDGLRLLAFGGIHIVNPSAVAEALRNYAPADGVFSITPFYTALCPTLDFRAYTPAEAFTWVDIGRPESLEKARLAAAHLRR